MPPRWMWHIDSELEAWFEDVDERRQAKQGGGGGADTTVPMLQNDLAKGKR